MAFSSRKYLNKLTVTVILIIFSLTLLPSISEEHMKMVLGSKHLGFVKRCVGCIPCMPTQVVSPPGKNNNLKAINTNQGDEGYYLLSWKCK
ncbi:hypothetical protein ACE6H2_022856 [Prunus campanulata]